MSYRFLNKSKLCYYLTSNNMIQMGTNLDVLLTIVI